MIKSSSFLLSIAWSDGRLFWPQRTGSKENNRAAAQLAGSEFQGGIVGDQFGERDARIAGELEGVQDQLADMTHLFGGKGAGKGGGHDAAGRVEGKTAGGQ